MFIKIQNHFMQLFTTIIPTSWWVGSTYVIISAQLLFGFGETISMQIAMQSNRQGRHSVLESTRPTSGQTNILFSKII